MTLSTTIRTGLYLCLLYFLLPAGQALAESARDLEQLASDIRKTDEQLESLKHTLEQNQALKNELQSLFTTTRDKRGERDQRLVELDERIAQFSASLFELETTVSAASENIAKHKSTLTQALRNAQNIGTDTSLKALLQHTDPALAQRLSTLRAYLFQAQSQQLNEAITYLESVENARLSTLKDKNWLVHIKAKATGQRDTLAKAEETTRQQLDTINSTLEQTSRTVDELEQDQQRLQSLMDKLESLQRSGSGYFLAYKGQFKMPVEGTIAARFGSRKSVGSLHWDGLYINAASGYPVNSVADGEVVYSDWLQGFGLLVVIDHGDGYMTLYGGNSEVMAQVGSWVSSGTTIASIGDSGGQNTSGLYFGIRHNARALDPLEWLSDEDIGSAATQM